MQTSNSAPAKNSLPPSPPGPAFGFSPSTYSEEEADSEEQVSITEVTGLQFGPGVSRNLIINSQTTDTGATGESAMLILLADTKPIHHLKLVLTSLLSLMTSSL